MPTSSHQEPFLGLAASDGRKTMGICPVAPPGGPFAPILGHFLPSAQGVPSRPALRGYAEAGETCCCLLNPSPVPASRIAPWTRAMVFAGVASGPGKRLPPGPSCCPWKDRPCCRNSRLGARPARRPSRRCAEENERPVRDVQLRGSRRWASGSGRQGRGPGEPSAGRLSPWIRT